MKLGYRKKHISTFRIIIFGFMSVILAGSALLMLPFSTKVWGGASFADALFTSTSATCVTGLVVRDTATYWSLFGQTVILIMIQIGGMGVVTMAILFTIISGRKIGLMQRTTLQESISAPHIGGVVKLTEFIVKTTVIIELAGAVILSFVFIPEFGVLKGIWYSVFHSVSAFCNAGFDLMGIKGEFSSLTSYAYNPLINIAVMALIIIGGIGFITWEDIKTNKFNISKYRMQSKMILSSTIALILLPFLFFYFYEFANRMDITAGQRVLLSLFQTVTPRTAGFNTSDTGALSEVGKAVSVILMLIGGAPGSTAGGIKVTTMMVLLLSSLAVFRSRESASCFGRRIAGDIIRNASTILVMYIVFSISGAVIICALENKPLIDCVFETASAIGTVGMSAGMTPELCFISRMILIALMFMGRVGGLTIIFAAFSVKNKNMSKLPEEKVTVG